MKIAFVVSFFDFRNDVRRMISELECVHEIVVLGREDQKSQIMEHLPEGVTYRPVLEKKRGAANSFWERLFLLFKAIPKSRNNFFLMELFKASNTSDPLQLKKNHRIFNWIKRLPKLISYDFYLDRLQYSGHTDITGIDQFIFFTAIADDYLLARLIREKHPRLSVYVYSWDHPCKHACFSKKVHYAVWNKGMAEDVAFLQNIPENQIRITGASQFGYIEEFHSTLQKNSQRTFPFRYLYFGCAIGIAELIPDEINVITTLSEEMARNAPDLILVVRPYPVQNNWDVYEPLRKLSNVVLDDGFRNKDLSVRDAHIMEKFEKIQHAEAFMHLGTTMGLEACFTDTPSFVLDMGYQSVEGLSLYNFIHQYQNDRHLINLAPQNAIKNREELRTALTQLSNDRYLELNRMVRQRYHLHSFAQVGRLLTD